ncbi:hypothetical protein [Hufsiella ginkgonis]|uniref:Uncharacterized protein n=1 Tax=Hufsiella ginkgonis TaxID=2695274 RepID=A0A7K1XXG0_9SPHI|nr:hypothetical protein [Hufsiella ginkgonis]MXV15632.1 hypothetical protein [Hufsiella ginkgonis]
MKIAVTILGIIIVAIVFGTTIMDLNAVGSGYSPAGGNSARDVADRVIANLDRESVEVNFPEKYFPRDQLRPLLAGLRQQCDWKSRDGKFVDYITRPDAGGVNQSTFIYEYYLKCDSLRFLLSVKGGSEPELTGFNVEPIENANPLIIHAENQLKNRNNNY